MKIAGIPTEGIDYWVYYKQLPPKIFAFVHSNGDGTYGVFLDPRRSHDQQVSDLEHELNHIIHDDFYNGLPIYLVEGWET